MEKEQVLALRHFGFLAVSVDYRYKVQRTKPAFFQTVCCVYCITLWLGLSFPYDLFDGVKYG